MIIVKLMGGLGNQMFQYALGRHLAIKNNSKLVLDLSFLNSEHKDTTRRYFELDCFMLSDCKIASAFDLFFVEDRKLKKILKKIFPIEKWKKYIKEKYVQYDSSVLNLSDAFLEGYWASERYFIEIENVVRREFSFKSLQAKDNNEIAQLISSVESVGLHIRRRDYVDNLKANQCHGICGLDYYEKAVKIIGQKCLSPHFFVFSDDILWAKKNLKLKYPIVYIDNNKKKSFEDMYLMSQCKHNIIANSSFSWWGAWLNGNPNKIVIAPKKWFNEPSLNAKDIVPNAWIKL